MRKRLEMLKRKGYPYRQGFGYPLPECLSVIVSLIQGSQMNRRRRGKQNLQRRNSFKGGKNYKCLNVGDTQISSDMGIPVQYDQVLSFLQFELRVAKSTEYTIHHSTRKGLRWAPFEIKVTKEIHALKQTESVPGDLQ